MFEIEFLHNFSLVNSSNGARRRTLLGPDEAKQRHATEIHPHYNDVFPVHYCSVYPEMCKMPVAVKIRQHQQKLERIWKTSSSVIGNANPWLQLRTSLGDEGWNPPSVAFVFQVFSTIQGKTKARGFAILAPRLYNRYNHAHVPGPHMWQSPGPGPGSKCSKTVEVGCSYSELKPCQREIDTDEIQEKKL